MSVSIRASGQPNHPRSHTLPKQPATPEQPVQREFLAKREWRPLTRGQTSGFIFCRRLSDVSHHCASVAGAGRERAPGPMIPAGSGGRLPAISLFSVPRLTRPVVIRDPRRAARPARPDRRYTPTADALSCVSVLHHALPARRPGGMLDQPEHPRPRRLPKQPAIPE